MLHTSCYFLLKLPPAMEPCETLHLFFINSFWKAVFKDLSIFDVWKSLFSVRGCEMTSALQNVINTLTVNIQSGGKLAAVTRL